jgi:hypothetical protein
MKTYARIQNGVVAEFIGTNGDITEMFHPDLVWVPCDGVTGIAIGWHYAGKTFSAPPPVVVAIGPLIEAAKAKVRTMRSSAFASLAGIQSQALANGDTATAKAISGLQDSLKALPDIDLTACKTQADIDAAFTAAWLAIVAAAPVNVASAFNGVQP